MSQQLAAIGERLLQISRSNQLTVSWQGRQWAAHLVEPLLQRRINGKTLTKVLRQLPGSVKWEDPTALALLPAAARSDPPNLGLANRIWRATK